MLTILSAWLLLSWYLETGRLFNLYGLFVSSAIAFNAGQALLIGAGLLTPGYFWGPYATNILAFPNDVAGPALLLVAWSLAMLHLGALIAARRWPPSRRQPHGDDGRLSTDARSRLTLRWLGCLLLIGSLPAAAFVYIRELSAVAQSGYVALYTQVQLSGGLLAVPRIVAPLFITATLMLLAGSRGWRFGVLLSFVSISVYTAGELYLGGRATAIMPAVAWTWLYTREIHRVRPALVLLMSAAVLFLVFPVVQATRTATGSSHSDYLGALSSVGNPLTYIIGTMGNSMTVVEYTMVLTPASRPFDYGVGYLSAPLSVIPNISGETSQAPARADYDSQLIKEIDPSAAGHLATIGYSIVAEGYINFGWLGPLLLAAMGGAIAALQLWEERGGGIERRLLVALWLSYALLLPREDLYASIRPILWYTCGPVLLFVICRRATSRRGTAAVGDAASQPPGSALANSVASLSQAISHQ